MNTIDKIRGRLDGMTKTERKVASWFLGHHHDFAFYPLEKVAQSAGVSTTSVIRFCRSLGFSGFRDYQDTLREEIRRQKDLPLKYRETMEHSSEDELLSLTVRRSLECISETMKALSPELLRESVRMISGAGRVYTFGMKESFSLAHYAYTRLLTVRDSVFLLDAPHGGVIEPLLGLTEEDAVIVFLFHRYTKAALDILPVLREQKAKVIMITDEPSDEVASFADLLLPCTVNAGGIKNTQTAPVCLMDYFCNAVAVENGEKTLAYMKKTEELFTRFSAIET